MLMTEEATLCVYTYRSRYLQRLRSIIVYLLHTLADLGNQRYANTGDQSFGILEGQSQIDQSLSRFIVRYSEGQLDHNHEESHKRDDQGEDI